MSLLSRRRFLTIAAASAALPAGAKAAPSAQWRGVALGAPVSMRFDGLTEAEAAPVIRSVEAELLRLEQIFSLYRDGSELSRLNREGHLNAPSPELLEVLSLAAHLHRASGGAFDPSVQPLWQALAQGADAEAVAKARDEVGFDRLRFDAGGVWFEAPGALTLNGIAQGAITDRIAELLRVRGLRHILIDMGEVAAIGPRRDGTPWRVGLAAPDGEVRQRLTLADRAVATSASDALILDSATGQGHILPPSGTRAKSRLVSVSATKAALADGLSTTLCLLDTAAAERLVAGFEDADLELFQS